LTTAHDPGGREKFQATLDAPYGLISRLARRTIAGPNRLRARAIKGIHRVAIGGIGATFSGLFNAGEINGLFC